MAKQKKPLTTAEAAYAAGVTKQAIFNAIARYEATGGRRGLRASRHGVAYAIAQADFEAWLEQVADRHESAMLGLETVRLAAAGAPDHEVGQ